MGELLEWLLKKENKKTCLFLGERNCPQMIRGNGDKEVGNEDI
jgi:hypothetical protein